MRQKDTLAAYLNLLSVDSRLLWDKVHAPFTLLLLYRHDAAMVPCTLSEQTLL